MNPVSIVPETARHVTQLLLMLNMYSCSSSHDGEGVPGVFQNIWSSAPITDGSIFSKLLYKIKTFIGNVQHTSTDGRLL